MTAKHDRPASAHPFRDRLIFDGRPVRTETDRQQAARFIDDVWDLAPGSFQQHHVRIILDFTTLPTPYRLIAKELALTLLSGPVPTRELGLPKVGTIVSLFASIRSFLIWLNTQAVHGKEPLPLSMVTSDDLLTYQQHLMATQLNRAVRDNHCVAIRYFWRYRTVLVSDQLTFDPRRIKGWGETGARSNTENMTARIPEAVLGPLVAWSLRFIDDFAPDILAADREWCRLRLGEGRIEPDTRRWVQPALEQLLVQHRATGRPLPGRNGRPNRRHLANLLGCDASTLLRPSYRELIDHTAREVGVCDTIALNITITGRLDGAPWIDEITTDRTDRAAGGTHLQTALRAACYVVIAFLSGMRDSEIKHLRRRCVTVKRDRHDRPYRWLITSLAFKGEHDPTGVQATWVVGAPVARAVAILEQLQPDDEPRLFAPTIQSPAVRRGQVADHVTLTTTTNTHLNDLIEWINDYCRVHGRDDALPDVHGTRWRLTTRQFRRTLAWFIARQPGGSVAGAIQYRHQAIHMFEGYAGTSDSGFRAEVEAEQALARGEHLMAMTDAHHHDGLSGPASDEARRRLTEYGVNIGYQGHIITDRRRQCRLLRRHDPAIYPGRYATCVFDPDKALCTRTTTRDGRLAPTLGECQPLHCRNVALTSGNIAALRAETTTIDTELTQRPALPPLLRTRLTQRREQIVQFTERYDPTDQL